MHLQWRRYIETLEARASPGPFDFLSFRMKKPDTFDILNIKGVSDAIQCGLLN